MALSKVIKIGAQQLFTHVENLMTSLDAGIRKVFMLDEPPRTLWKRLEGLVTGCVWELLRVPRDYLGWLADWWSSGCTSGTLVIGICLAAFAVNSVYNRKWGITDTKKEISLYRVGELLSDSWPTVPGEESNILYRFEEFRTSDSMGDLSLPYIRPSSEDWLHRKIYRH